MGTTVGSAYCSWRWLTGTLLLLGIFATHILTNVPSPILPLINDDLRITLAQSGFFMSVICIIFSFSNFFLSGIGDRFNSKIIFLLGLLLMAGGQLLFIVTNGYLDLLVYRCITGVGMGICNPVYAMLVMENFPDNERPLINTIYAALPYAATFVALYTVVPMYYAFGESWRLTLGAFGAIIVIIAVVWFLCLPKIASPDLSKHKIKDTDEENPGMRRLLVDVAKNREVRLLTVADIADTWGYNFLNTFLPTYFYLEQGMSLEQAAALTSIFPLVGVIAGLLGGYFMTKVGLRKPFTWPSHLCVFAGTLMLVLGTGPVRIAGIILAGVGNAAWAPALFTMPMEFEGMTPAKAGAAFAFIFGIGYLLGAFLSPLVGGWMGDIMSLRSALIVNSFVALVAAICCFLMKETGPKKKMKQAAVN